MKINMIFLAITGETFFVGLLVGIATYLLISWKTKSDNKKQEKIDGAEIEYLDRNITQRGGLPVILRTLINYLKSNLYYTDSEIHDMKSIVTMINQFYEVTFMLYGSSNKTPYDTYSLFIRNVYTKKSKKWEFKLSDSQNEIIRKIDPVLKKELK